MKKLLLLAPLYCSAQAPQPTMILAEQSQHRIIIVEPYTGKTTWEWKPDSAHANWFKHPSDAKVVYNGKYVITCASGGGVAMIRIRDKRTMFYAYAGGNTHSVEILPDGNLVSASSTGNFMTVFKVDTTSKSTYQKQIPLPFGHNVVWDKQRKLLWSAGAHYLYRYKYNFDCERPDFQLIDSVSIPGKEGHDLFPVFDRDSLWLTSVTHFARVDAATRKMDTMHVKTVSNIKSVSSGPPGYPTIVIVPKESWWTDEVLDIQGKSVFRQAGLRIYKARWALFNDFSYDGNDWRQCK
ncbi:DUF6528 family protein [Chitinophaga horti]|uniref:DUF6528 family protein n=1 Tax=Chitinophaga horti TaxID=2920382 RepID=A0ABY6J3D5_9BACT|nr:DUF6528 family protein [Chitinophaga horti]UYQ92702.1 DUF6528 family protein [Chitinophaga horti]